MGGGEVSSQGLGPEKVSSARGRGGRMQKWVRADRFPRRSWSVQILACGEGTSCTPAYCSTGLKFSIFLFSDKAPLEQILTKNPMSLGKKS